MRDPRTLSLKWGDSIKPLLLAELREPKEEDGKRMPEGLEDIKKTKPSESARAKLVSITEIKAECTGFSWVCTGASAYILWLPVTCLNGIPAGENQ